MRPVNWAAGVTSIYDLRQEPVADIRDPFHCLMFYLPRAAINEVTAEAGSPPLDELRYPRAVGIDDTIARQLLSSVLPAIAQPEHAHPLFLDHVVMAMASHVAYAYGNVRAKHGHRRGGLASWRLRRATQMMSETLGEGLAFEPAGAGVRSVDAPFRARVPAVDRGVAAPLVAAASRRAREGIAPQARVAARPHRVALRVRRSESLHTGLQPGSRREPEPVASRLFVARTGGS